MTAYIKMIDIWMIFTMLYPFCVVTLYSILQFLVAQDQDIPVAMKIDKTKWKIKGAAKLVNVLLDVGLPAIVIMFIILFWILGITNTTSAEINHSC